MVTYCDTKLSAICSPMIGQFVDTMILASTGIVWLKWPIKLLSLGKYWKLFSATLKSSWSRCYGFCPVLSQCFKVIIRLVARFFCWIHQWTTGRWRTTFVRVKYWSLQRKIQPWLIYVFCSYSVDIPRCLHLIWPKHIYCSFNNLSTHDLYFN